MQIRPSTPSDLQTISRLHKLAFGSAEGPEIAKLVNDLFEDQTAFPLFSFVATRNGEIAGHILFTSACLEGTDSHLTVQILAPLAVLPGHQSSGVGCNLIDHGLRELKRANIDLVFVLGHPEYYPRFGFSPALPLGLAAPYPIPEKNADAWMVQDLRGGLAGNVSGCVQCSDVLSEPRHWRE